MNCDICNQPFDEIDGPIFDVATMAVPQDIHAHLQCAIAFNAASLSSRKAWLQSFAGWDIQGMRMHVSHENE